jgi:PAS domain S-box-containing protein
MHPAGQKPKLQQWPSPRNAAQAHVLHEHSPGAEAALPQAKTMIERPNSAEQRLREDAEQQYRLLMENVKDFAIFLLDTNGRIATWNSGAERILGFKEEEIIGQPYAIIFTPQDIVKDQPQYELEIARDKGRSEDERWHVRKDSRQFWASGVVTPLWDEDGTLRGFAKVMRDITARKRAETELAEANRRKDEFLAMLGHELRNPLAPISNSLHALRLEQLVSPTAQEAIAMIDRQAKRLIRLVDDLLDVSRITTGKIHVRKERVDLYTIINHAVETTWHLVESRKLELTVSLPTESIWLEADPARMEQVMSNLISNAAKYTEPGGRIWVTVERQGSEATVSIKDTGIGILSEMLPDIFDLFVQGDRSLDRAQGGLGIGLTLVKALVQMHEGRVLAHSPGVGKGAEFIVRLPVVAEVLPIQPEEGAAPIPRGRSLRLLVVDDSKDTVDSLAMVMRANGHEVSTANSGPAGLRAALSEPLDAVLLDLGLPGIDGYEIATRIREKNDKVLLIAITGYGQKADRERSKKAGFNHHLVKPVDPMKLQQLLVEFTCPASSPE